MKTQLRNTSKPSPEIDSCFDEYLHSRIEFVCEINRLVDKSKYIPYIVNGGAIESLRSLLEDGSESIQENAALALGKIARSNVKYAVKVREFDLIPRVIIMMKNSRKFKPYGAFLLRSISQHGSDLASEVIKGGGVKLFYSLCRSGKPSNRENGLWSLLYLAIHDEACARKTIPSEKSMKLIIRLINDENLDVQAIAICLLSNVVKHSVSLAKEFLSSADLLTHIAALVDNYDGMIRRQVFSFLAHVCKYEREMTESVISQVELFPQVIKAIHTNDVVEKRNAVTCLLSLTKHGVVDVVVKRGGLDPLIENCVTTGPAQWPSLKCVGFICAAGDEYRVSCVEKGALETVLELLEPKKRQENEEAVIVACVWILGQLGNTHAPSVRDQMIRHDVLGILEDIHNTDSSTFVQSEALGAFSSIISKCKDVAMISPMVNPKTHPKILKIVLKQMGIILSRPITNSEGKVTASEEVRKEIRDQKRAFAQSKGFKYIQKLKMVKRGNPRNVKGTKELIRKINAVFPVDIVNFNTPGHEEKILKMIGGRRKKQDRDRQNMASRKPSVTSKVSGARSNY